MKISYNWLKAYVPEIPEPNRLADIFTYHLCEVESVEKLPDGDFLFDLGILPNRAHDLLSHQGVARELSGLLGIEFKDPTPMYKTPASKPTNLKVEIETENCRRYSARIVRNIKVGPSPEWMVKHLESIGQRSINNIVDATNIVMYDCGQPTHAFDLQKIVYEKIKITNAKEGDELKLVGREGVTAKLKENDLVITSGGINLALGGVKGGHESGISDTTTDIVLEVANFNPTSVRKTARRIGQLSDSAKRFENDLSPELCDFGMFALSALLIELFPEATFEEIVDVYPKKQESHNLEFSKKYIENLLGLKISDSEIEDILKRYKFDFTKSEDNFSVSIPPMRLDLTNREDMAEEIARIIGYDKIKPVLPRIKVDLKENETYQKISKAREILASNGYLEVMTYAFANTGVVEVLASASDKKFLRTNLTDGLKESYELNKLNAPYLNLNEIKIFEIGTVFTKNGEEVHVAYANKKEIKEISLDEFEEIFLKVLGSPAKTQALGRPDHSENLSLNSSENINYFKMWSLYPFVTRDIAVWVPDNVSPEELSNIYHEFGTELLVKDPILVDTFKKDGRISYAFRLIFQSYDRTLTTEEINLLMSKITEKLSSLGFEVR
jgi:phenylalanyl-tRNA synthetase beta chain